MRDWSVHRPASCAKTRRAPIARAHPCAAVLSFPFACNADRPFDARSAFSRQRIADDIALRFDDDGLADVLAHAPAAATPLRCASVGWFSFGEIAPPPLARTDSAPFSTSTAGPRMPLVASALTTPPPLFGVTLAGVEPLSSSPPPPQPAIKAIAANATNL